MFAMTGADGSRMGPPSNSDRLSHRTDKSWRRESSQPPAAYGMQQAANSREYTPSRGEYPPRDYMHSREMSPSVDHYGVHHQGSRQPHESRHSGTATSTISSSSSEDDSDQPPPHGMHPGYGYNGYYPGYQPSQAGGYAQSQAGMYGPPPGATGYPHGTIKSAKSVPALVAATYDGEPCPVHHGGMPVPPPMSMPPMPPMVHPGYATMGHPRRSASIYDMRMMMTPAPPPPAIYGTLPMPAPVASDARSVVGSTMMSTSGAPVGIPAQLLPPMARPRPLVIGEGGTPEVLPVRADNEKGATLPKALLASKAAAAAAGGSDDGKSLKKPFCCRGGVCVSWIILSVIVIGILLTLMLLFIL